MAKLRIALLSAAHLFMDMTTVAFLYVLTGVREFSAVPEGWSAQPALAVAGCVLAYDLLAFGLQPFIGVLADLKRRAAPLLYASLFGAGICAAACVLCGFPQGVTAGGIALLALFSLCNALFHVSAGAFVIPESESKCAPLGVFVAPGALGVALGRLYAPAVLFAAGAGLVVFGGCLFALKTKDGALQPHFARTEELEVHTQADLLPLALLAFAVFVRGLGGTALPAGYGATALLVLLAAVAAAVGKAAGGFLADALGSDAAALILPLSACLLAFGSGVPALYLIGLALFNTSMPVTLWLSFAALPRLRNTAFGVMACFLMLGSLLAMALPVPWPLAFTLVIASAAAVFAAPRLCKNKSCLPVGRIKRRSHV